jgi:asparagine synthase (glutamine-hydrolysing)
MCGIVGYLSSRDTIDVNSVKVPRDTLTHRGPDSSGMWSSGNAQVVLGHRRLAIIELSDLGSQPMEGAGGELRIVFNGEIYNHRDLRRTLEQRGHHFRTQSDTEVILAAYEAWGTDSLRYLNGMFAFALHDARDNTVFFARDRAGEKPLFYRHANGGLRFASELKALLSDDSAPRTLDIDSLDAYLSYGYVPGDACILQGYRKLAPAHAMVYSLTTDRLKIWRYWDLPESPQAATGVNPERLVDELESLLSDAVSRQMVADVPIGILLSGGLDSSLVTAFASRNSSRAVNTFTVTFPGHGHHDEGPFARLVAAEFGTRHTELVAEPATVDLLPMLAKQFDEPIGDSAIVPTYMVSALIRKFATVALGGDGGDELFGGYPHYSALIRRNQIRKGIPRVLRAALALGAARALPTGTAGRNHLIGFAGPSGNSIAHINMYFDSWTRRRLLHRDSAPKTSSISPEMKRQAVFSSGQSLLRQAMEADFRTTLADGYLVKVDRAAMCASLETRAPWLDYRVIEFAFGRVPDHLKVNKANRKILPRMLGTRFLPKTLDLRRKQGFSMPLNAWFQKGWGDYMESVLREGESRLFDQRVLTELLDGQKAGRANVQRLFALTMFELWRRQYRIEIV